MKRFLLVAKEDNRIVASVNGLNEVNLTELESKGLEVIDSWEQGINVELESQDGTYIHIYTDYEVCDGCDGTQGSAYLIERFTTLEDAKRCLDRQKGNQKGWVNKDYVCYLKWVNYIEENYSWRTRDTLYEEVIDTYEEELEWRGATLRYCSKDTKLKED